MTINIRKFLVDRPRRKRQMRLAGYVRNRIAHYTKVDEANVRIDRGLNEAIVKRYVKSMLPLRVRVSIAEGKATASCFVEDGKRPAEAAPAAKAGKADKRPAAGPAAKNGAKGDAGAKPDGK